MLSILKSEKAKVIAATKKATGVACDITGAGWKEPDQTGDPILDGFVEVKFEMCDSRTGRFVAYAILQVVLFDRRRSWVSQVIAR